MGTFGPNLAHMENRSLNPPLSQHYISNYSIHLPVLLLFNGSTHILVMSII
jgi:hypothetical protein